MVGCVVDVVVVGWVVEVVVVVGCVVDVVVVGWVVDVVEVVVVGCVVDVVEVVVDDEPAESTVIVVVLPGFQPAELIVTWSPGATLDFDNVIAPTGCVVVVVPPCAVVDVVDVVVVGWVVEVVVDEVVEVEVVVDEVVDVEVVDVEVVLVDEVVDGDVVEVVDDEVVVTGVSTTVHVNPPGWSAAFATTVICAFQNLSSDAGCVVLSTHAMPML